MKYFPCAAEVFLVEIMEKKFLSAFLATSLTRWCWGRCDTKTTFSSRVRLNGSFPAMVNFLSFSDTKKTSWGLDKRKKKILSKDSQTIEYKRAEVGEKSFSLSLFRHKPFQWLRFMLWKMFPFYFATTEKHKETKNVFSVPSDKSRNFLQGLIFSTVSFYAFFCGRNMSVVELKFSVSSWGLSRERSIQGFEIV